MPLTTATGREFTDVDSLLAYVRQCQKIMFDPAASHVETLVATTEQVYAFRSLDEYLTHGGRFPLAWTESR